MSHVAQVDLEIKDLEALAKACSALGLELVTGQKTYKWFGQSVGDYPLPAGFTAADLGKCEHAIRIPQTSADYRADTYEVGVVRRRDGKPGYSLMWDFFAGGYGLQNKVGEGCRNLKREYANAVATRTAQRQGFCVMEQRRADGSIQLTLSK